MKGLIFYILSMIIAFHAAGDNKIATKQQVKTISELQNQLKDMKQYTAEAVYEILLPSNDNTIKYHIEMQSVAVNDTLSPCNYLISWRNKDNINKPTEFTSYKYLQLLDKKNAITIITINTGGMTYFVFAASFPTKGMFGTKLLWCVLSIPLANISNSPGVKKNTVIKLSKIAFTNTIPIS